jgi:two-component system sensor histidine kinase TtrS
LLKKVSPRLVFIIASFWYCTAQPAWPAQSAAPADPRPAVSIAVPDTLVNPMDTMALRQTISKLRQQLPNYRIDVVSLVAAEADDGIRRMKPDFIFAPAGFLQIFAKTSPVSFYQIATRRNLHAPEAEKAVGAAFLVKAGRTDLTDLKSLRGKRAISGLPIAVDGWLAAQGEIQKAGFDPEKFFSHAEFRNNAYPDAVSALAAGSADVAVVPACLLETLEGANLVAKDEFRVIGAKDGTLLCRHSTDLYPDISFYALLDAPHRAVRDVTVALLAMEALDHDEWLPNVSQEGVSVLFRDLRVGHYAFLRDMTPAALYERHKSAVWTGLLILALLILNEARLHRLVKIRTRDLRETIRQKDAVEAQNAEIRSALASLERQSVVQQMSGMIAHEINAPIGSIRAYAAVLLLQNAGGAQKAVLEKIDGEAQRIAEIIRKVRAYRHSKKANHAPCDLRAVVGRAVKALAAERSPAIAAAIRIEADDMAPGAMLVSGDALELEILFLNLLRNASNAIRYAECEKDGEEPFIRVGIRRDAMGERPQYRITVANPGREIGDAEFERLSHCNASPVSNPEGLGLGLTICRGICDNHGALMRLARRTGGGLIVTVLIDALAENTVSEGTK